MQCQHCMAICPTAAISIMGHAPDKSAVLKKDRLPTLTQMELLIRGRRSIRKYLDENVDPALLKRIIAAQSNAPTGVNMRELTLHVVDNINVMHKLRETCMAALKKADDEDRIPEHFADLHQAVPSYFEMQPILNA